MMDELPQIRRKVEQLRRDADRAQGALDAEKRFIRENFGCKSLKEAEGKLLEKADEERQIAEEYAAEFDAFLKRWPHLLEKET